jgi:ribose 5-phosphate isomerase B
LRPAKNNNYSLATKGMRISIGSDHAGFALKGSVLAHLQALGNDILDRGTMTADSVDYPDHAHAVASDVAERHADLGIVICGSANGVNITANKHAGIRSAIAWNPEVAQLARAHNNANVLALPARFIDDATALRIVDAFLMAAFEGGRHERRVEKIEQGA